MCHSRSFNISAILSLSQASCRVTISWDIFWWLSFCMAAYCWWLLLIFLLSSFSLFAMKWISFRFWRIQNGILVNTFLRWYLYISMFDDYGGRENFEKFYNLNAILCLNCLLTFRTFPLKIEIILCLKFLIPGIFFSLFQFMLHAMKT